MIPLVMASFVFALRNNTLIWKVLAGIACALMILSGHPEPSFFGIVCSSMLYIFLRLLHFGSAESEAGQARIASSLARNLAFALLDIAIIGVVAFSFCAFMLLPFLELLKNSDCYKLGLEGHRFGVPLNSILINLIHPAYNNSSPFLGILSVPLCLFAVLSGFKAERVVKALSACTLVSIAIMSQLGPLDALMNSSAFSWFVPKYCWPSLLIFISLLSAKGFENLIDFARNEWRKASIAIIIISLLVLLGLGLIRVSPDILQCIRQDEAFERMQVFGKFWTKDLICLTVFALLVAGSKFFGKLQSIICVLTVSVCTVLSIAPVAKLASPITVGFNYDMVDPIPFLEAHPGRILTLGRHVFCPSSNFVYGLNNLVPVNVYHPRRFQDFLVACGVTPEGVNQFFDGRVSSLVDYASVKYLVSPQPVLSKAESVSIPQALLNNLNVSWGKHGELQLVGGALDLYRQNRELIGSLKFSVPPDMASDLAVQSILTDEKGNVLWLGDAERLLYLFDKRPTGVKRMEITRDLLVPLPEIKGRLALTIQIFNFKALSYLPLTEPGSSEKNKVPIADCDLSSGDLQSRLLRVAVAADSARRYRLCAETGSRIRVYENLKALPQAYLTRNCEVLSDEKAVLSDLLSHTDSAARVLFERSNGPKTIPGSNELIVKQGEMDAAESASFKRIDCNHIEVSTNTNKPAFLVLSENYYPGWHAEIEHEGIHSEAQISRANYLFQAVDVPRGKSIVRFTFRPAGFTSGLILLGLALPSLLAILLVQFLKNKKVQK
jgi:hypothetical protein